MAIFQTANSHKTSSLVSEQVPDFVRSDHPVFVTFLEKYYEFLAQANTGISVTGDATTHYYGADYASKLLPDIADIDTTDLDKFLESFRKQYGSTLPQVLHEDTNTRTFYKNLIDFYRSVGTEDSFKFLFRLLYNDDDVELYYPKEDMLIASGGDWKTQVRIKVNYVDYLNDIENKKIIGATSGAYGTVEKVQVLDPEQDIYISGNIAMTSASYVSGASNSEIYDSHRGIEETSRVAFVYMSDQSGKFELFEEVYVDDSSVYVSNTIVLPVTKSLLFYDEFDYTNANSVVSMTDALSHNATNSTNPPWASANIGYGNTGIWHMTGLGAGEIKVSSNSYMLNYIPDSFTGTVLEIGNNSSTGVNTAYGDMRHFVYGRNIGIGGEDKLYRMQIRVKDLGGNSASSVAEGNRFSAGVACIRHDFRRLSGDDYKDQWDDPLWLVSHKQAIDDNFFTYVAYFRGRELKKEDSYPAKNYGSGGRQDLTSGTRYYNSAQKAMDGEVRLPFNTTWIRPTFKVNEPGTGATYSQGVTQIDYVSIEEIDSMQTQVGKNSGAYQSERSLLSTKSAHLYDGYYRQFFAYDIRSKQENKMYDSIVRETIHPAGLKMFGTKISESKIGMGVNENNIIPRGYSTWDAPESDYSIHHFGVGDATTPYQILTYGSEGTNVYVDRTFGHASPGSLRVVSGDTSSSEDHLLKRGTAYETYIALANTGGLSTKDKHLNQSSPQGIIRFPKGKKWIFSFSAYSNTYGDVPNWPGASALIWLSDTDDPTANVSIFEGFYDFTSKNKWTNFYTVLDFSDTSVYAHGNSSGYFGQGGNHSNYSKYDQTGPLIFPWFTYSTGATQLPAPHHNSKLSDYNSMILRLDVDGATGNTVWFDDVQMYEVGAGVSTPEPFRMIGADNNLTDSFSPDQFDSLAGWWRADALGPENLQEKKWSIDIKANAIFGTTTNRLPIGGSTFEDGALGASWHSHKIVANNIFVTTELLSSPIGDRRVLKITDGHTQQYPRYHWGGIGTGVNQTNKSVPDETFSIVIAPRKKWLFSTYVRVSNIVSDETADFDNGFGIYAMISNNSGYIAGVEEAKTTKFDVANQWERKSFIIDLSGIVNTRMSFMFELADRSKFTPATGNTVYHFDGMMFEEYSSAIHGAYGTLNTASSGSEYTPSPYVLPGMNGANVLSWYDQSPNKHHVYANTHGGTFYTPQFVANAINSKPAIRFSANTVKNTSNVYEFSSIGGTSNSIALEFGDATNFKPPTSGLQTRSYGSKNVDGVGTLASDSLTRTVSNTWTIMAVVKSNLRINETNYDSTLNPTIFNSGYGGNRDSNVLIPNKAKGTMNLGYDVVGNTGAVVTNLVNNRGEMTQANTGAGVADLRDTHGRTPITDPAGTNFVPRALSIFDSPDADYSIQVGTGTNYDQTAADAAKYTLTANLSTNFSGIRASIVTDANSVIGGTSLSVINSNIGDGALDQRNARQILFSNTVSTGGEAYNPGAWGQPLNRPPRAVPDVGTFTTYGIQIPKGKRWIYSLHAQADSVLSDGIFLSWITSNGTAIPLDHTSIHANTPRSDGFAIAEYPNSTDLTRYQAVIDLTGSDGAYYANNSADRIILGFQVKRTNTSTPTVFYVDALQLEEVATGVTTPTTFQLSPGSIEHSPPTEDSFRIVGVSVDASGIDYAYRLLYTGTLGHDGNQDDDGFRHIGVEGGTDGSRTNLDDGHANLHIESYSTATSYPRHQQSVGSSTINFKGSEGTFVRVKLRSNSVALGSAIWRGTMYWKTDESEAAAPGGLGFGASLLGALQYLNMGYYSVPKLDQKFVEAGPEGYVDAVWDMRNAPIDNNGDNVWMDRTIRALRFDLFLTKGMHYDIKEISVSKQDPRITPEDHLNFHIDGRRFANSEINNSRADLSSAGFVGHSQNAYVTSIGNWNPAKAAVLPFPVYPEANGIMGVGATGNVNFLVNISNTNILPATVVADGFWGEMYVSNLGGIDFVSPNGSIIPTHSGNYGIKTLGSSTVYTHYEGSSSASDTPTKGTGEDSYLMYSNMNAAARFGTGTGSAGAPFGNHMHIIPVEWDVANNTWLAIHNRTEHSPDGTAATAFVPDTANGDFLVARMRRVNPGVGHTGLTEFESFIFAANSQNQSYSGGIGNASVLGTHTGFINQKREVKNWHTNTFFSDTYRDLVTGTANWDGDIAEIVVFNEKLSNTNIALTEGYLAHKYGLETNLIHKDGPTNETELYRWEFANTTGGWKFPSSLNWPTTKSGITYEWESSDANNYIRIEGYGAPGGTANMQINLSTHIDGSAYDNFEIRYMVDYVRPDYANVFQFGWRNTDSSTIWKLPRANGYTSLDTWYQNTYNLSANTEWNGKKINYLEYSFIDSTGSEGGADDYKIDFVRVFGNKHPHPYRWNAPSAIGANGWNASY